MNHRRLEETLQMLLKEKKEFKDHRAVARAADNIGHADVGDWIRKNPAEFHLWISIYSGAYPLPEVEEHWE